jgi:hypothetical protein
MRTVKIAECSKELTARERLMLKDTTNANKLDTLLNDEAEVIIEPAMYATLNVVFDTPDEGEDYEQYVIIDNNGNKYVTGSQSFWNAFKDIVDEMGDEPFEIVAYRKDSKNRPGKYFITCSIR